MWEACDWCDPAYFMVKTQQLLINMIRGKDIIRAPSDSNRHRQWY